MNTGPGARPSAAPNAGLSIGQAAAFAGVTVKTVRHYHRLGLVDEPSRGANGYRRYGSSELLRLIQVRTLGRVGVPLAEVADLLDSEPEDFTAGLADAEVRLTRQIDDLVERRAALRRLADGDRTLLPERACAVVRRLVDLRLPPEYVDSQREALLLVHALVPGELDAFLDQLGHRLDDPEYVELTRRSWEATSWDPDDPRLDELAAAVADNLLTHLPPKGPGVNGDGDESGNKAQSRSGTKIEERLTLINRHREDESPTLARLGAMIEAHLARAGIETR
jgi:DNA-binding transcriptional MerR regulator